MDQRWGNINETILHSTHTNKQMASVIWVFISSVLETDGEADNRMLGSQPGLPPHSSAGQKDTCQNVRITGYQAVNCQRQLCIERTIMSTLAPIQATQTFIYWEEKAGETSWWIQNPQNFATQVMLKTILYVSVFGPSKESWHFVSVRVSYTKQRSLCTCSQRSPRRTMSRTCLYSCRETQSTDQEVEKCICAFCESYTTCRWRSDWWNWRDRVERNLQQNTSCHSSSHYWLYINIIIVIKINNNVIGLSTFYVTLD